MNMTVTVYSMPNVDDARCRHRQLFDVPAIPRTGERFSLWSSRDDNGNYHYCGMPHKVFEGVVHRVEWQSEEWGRDLDTNRKTIYVSIFLDGESSHPRTGTTSSHPKTGTDS